MRLFIFPGTLYCDNHGDVVMLQVALRRLRARWPGALVHVLTENAERLLANCPGVQPVAWNGFRRWIEIGALPKIFFPEIPAAARKQFPAGLAGFFSCHRLLRPRERAEIWMFARAFFQADLVVLTGCGLLNDAFKSRALLILQGLAAAQRAGIPTALLGQGIGPVNDNELVVACARVFGGAKLIGLREHSGGSELMERFKVAAEKICVTGDDALVAARAFRTDVSGCNIGVNLRRAGYAQVGDHSLPIIQAAIMRSARSLNAVIQGIPILHATAHSDIETLRTLFGEKSSGKPLTHPEEVLRAVSGCRVMVTGSYHAAVFALAQGIPAIGLAQSDYYQQKFSRLMKMFGGLCPVLRLDDADLEARLATAITEFWGKADMLRAPLQKLADEQILAGEKILELLRL